MMRLAGALVRSLCAAPLAFDGTSIIRVRTSLFDLDLFGHVTNARYLSIMNVGRLDYCVRTGIVRFALRHRAVLLMTRVQVDYRAPLRLWKEVAVETRLPYWDDRSFFFEHRLVRDGHLCAAALAVTVLRSRGHCIEPASVVSACGGPARPPADRPPGLG